MKALTAGAAPSRSAVKNERYDIVIEGDEREWVRGGGDVLLWVRAVVAPHARRARRGPLGFPLAWKGSDDKNAAE